MRSTRLCFTIILLGGCGGGDDGGTGSGTLRVDGDVEASPEVTNASDAVDFTTDFSVRVTRSGEPVTAGEVVVTSDGGEVPLVFDGEQWRGAQAGYFEVYALDVTAGDDFVHGVRVDGPDIHVFTAPVADGAVDATAVLTVAWSRDDQADEATLETRETDPVDIADTGAFELAAFTLRNSPDQTEEEELRLTRASRISPEGAVAGSELRVEIENRLELLVAATGG